MLKNVVLLLSMAMALSACELKDALDAVNSTPGQLAQTNAAVHKQELAQDIDGMQKPENQQLLVPVPVRLIPYGKDFAEAATQQELLDFVYSKIQEIQEVNPMNKVDANGNDIPLTQDQLDQLRISKTGTLYSLFIISGYIPQAMLDAIIHDQILGRGRYEELALNILMMRVIFWRDIMLDSDLLAKPMKNAKMMNMAIEDLNKIEYVLELPFVSQVSMHIKDGVHNFVDTADSLTKDGSLVATTGEWKKAYNNALSAEQSYQKQSLTGNAQQDEAAYHSELQSQLQALSVMKQHADAWAAQLP